MLICVRHFVPIFGVRYNDPVKLKLLTTQPADSVEETTSDENCKHYLQKAFKVGRSNESTYYNIIHKNIILDMYNYNIYMHNYNYNIMYIWENTRYIAN